MDRQLFYKILAQDVNNDEYSNYSGSVRFSDLFRDVEYDTVIRIIDGGVEQIKTAMNFSITPSSTTDLDVIDIKLSLNDDIPDYDIDKESDEEISDSEEEDYDEPWIVKYTFDSHWDCYCKTRQVCGCGCDPLHDGW